MGFKWHCGVIRSRKRVSSFKLLVLDTMKLIDMLIAVDWKRACLHMGFILSSPLMKYRSTAESALQMFQAQIFSNRRDLEWRFFPLSTGTLWIGSLASGSPKTWRLTSNVHVHSTRWLGARKMGVCSHMTYPFLSFAIRRNVGRSQYMNVFYFTASPYMIQLRSTCYLFNLEKAC